MGRAADVDDAADRIGWGREFVGVGWIPGDGISCRRCRNREYHHAPVLVELIGSGEYKGARWDGMQVNNDLCFGQYVTVSIN